jgi:ribosomal protein S12 methylthiotransferase
MKKVALVSLGCAKNLVDSEVMLGYLDRKGNLLTPDQEKADIIIINTCGFIQPAREEAADALNKAAALKREFPDKKIIAAGCYVERNKLELMREFPEIDEWTGIKDFDKIVSIMEGRTYEESARCFLYDHNSPRLRSTPLGWAYIKISEGCSHQCGFCAIPLIKGPYRSRKISSIAEEAAMLADEGIREINLISQDSTYFGRDEGVKNGLTMLLRALLQVDVDWIRVLYSYPEEVDDSLLEVMREEKICSYFDIPFQHADPVIIKHMKRGFDGKRAVSLLDKIRQKIPDAVIRTSLVVGFPGEGKEEFQNLVDFVRTARVDHLGVFSYSPEKGTSCYSLGDPVEEEEKREREEEILQIQQEISFKNNKKYVKETMDVLIEGYVRQDASLMVGRSQYQAPEVDGVVFTEAGRMKQDVVSTIQKVEITGCDAYDLYGRKSH